MVEGISQHAIGKSLPTPRRTNHPLEGLPTLVKDYLAEGLPPGKTTHPLEGYPPLEGLPTP